MKNKTVMIVFSVLFAIILVNTVFAHSGMTDEAGGHWDEENHEYHYHCGGNPAHKHIGTICPYDRVPADTSNKGNYGNGNSNNDNKTRKENTMDVWDIISIAAIVLFVVVPIVITIFESICEKIRNKRKKSETKTTTESAILDNGEQKVAELNREITALKNENSELKKVIDEQSTRLSALNNENEKLKNKLIEERNTVADAEYEVTKSREKEKIDLENLTRNLSHAFNDYELLNKYYRGVTKGKLENAFNTKLSISKIQKFNLETEIISKNEDDIKKYNTTFDSCDCEDYIYRCKKEGVACKHMLFLMYSFGVLQLQPERLKASFLVGKH